MKNDLFIAIERLSNLLRGESRNEGLSLGLLPVQHDALFYLSICNRYSDNPLAVADYLGLTKGTVSQSLKVLEERGLLQKVGDPQDKRKTHLILTAAGRQYVDKTSPPAKFLAAQGQINGKDQALLSAQLQHLLRVYQIETGRQGFGVCRGCRFNQSEKNNTFRCGLTQEALSKQDTALICREFQVAD